MELLFAREILNHKSEPTSAPEERHTGYCKAAFFLCPEVYRDQELTENSVHANAASWILATAHETSHRARKFN